MSRWWGKNPNNYSQMQSRRTPQRSGNSLIGFCLTTNDFNICFLYFAIDYDLVGTWFNDSLCKQCGFIAGKLQDSTTPQKVTVTRQAAPSEGYFLVTFYKSLPSPQWYSLNPIILVYGKVAAFAHPEILHVCNLFLCLQDNKYQYINGYKCMVCGFGDKKHKNLKLWLSQMLL